MNMTFDKRWKLCFSYCTLGAAAAFVLLILYWLIFPWNILDVSNEPATVNKKTVRAGETLVYHTDFCRYTDKPGEVTRQFIDDIIYTTEPITVTERKRCGERDVLVKIPNSLPPDNYHIKVILKVKVNPIRTVTEEFITEEFEVIKGGE